MAVSLTSSELLAAEADDERRLQALEIELLLTGLAERYGYDFRHYARASLTRRDTLTVPELGAVSPAISRKAVDFPQPERPSRETNSPRFTSRSSGPSAVTPVS